MSKTALIVVDVINEALTGVFACERVSAIVPPLKKLVAYARKSNMPVIFTNDAHLKNIDRELHLWGEHSMKGTAGAEVIADLTPLAGEFVIEKRRYNAFFQTSLHLLLTELGVDTVIVTGLLAHICVLNTVAEAYFWGYKIFVPADCTDCKDADDYNYALDYMNKIYAADVKKSAELIKSLK